MNYFRASSSMAVNITRFVPHMPMRLLLMLFTLLLMACNADDRPDTILPSDNMVDIMVDMHLAETAGNMKLVDLDSLTPSYGGLYEAIFEKHGITKTAFDSTLYFYSVRPEEMNAIYDKVLERLSEMDSKQGH